MKTQEHLTIYQRVDSLISSGSKKTTAVRKTAAEFALSVRTVFRILKSMEELRK